MVLHHLHQVLSVEGVVGFVINIQRNPFIWILVRRGWDSFRVDPYLSPRLWPQDGVVPCLRLEGHVHCPLHCLHLICKLAIPLIHLIQAVPIFWQHEVPPAPWPEPCWYLRQLWLLAPRSGARRHHWWVWQAPQLLGTPVSGTALILFRDVGDIHWSQVVSPRPHDLGIW